MWRAAQIPDDRPVYHRTKEEEDRKSLDRFGGCIVNDISLGGKLQTLGWYRGSVQDAGGFYSYYREEPELSMGVELHFSGSFVGGQDEEVPERYFSEIVLQLSKATASSKEREENWKKSAR